jgi:integrase
VIAASPSQPSRATGRVARSFLAGRCSFAGEELRLERLTAAHVSAFMLEHRPAGAVAVLVLAPVHAAVVGGSGRRASRRGVANAFGQGGDAAAGCDCRTAIGRRDYAILTVLVRLGLRAGEVAALTLEDIEWRAGELVVFGKGGRRDCRYLSTSASAGRLPAARPPAR